MESSPLTEVAMSYIRDAERKIEPEQMNFVRDIIDRFVNNQISYQECTNALVPLLGSSQPIDKIDAIIRTPDQPLPPVANYREMDQQNFQSIRAKTRPWTTYEDQRLLAGLHRFGFEDWSTIAAFVGNGRTKAQCAQRWSRGLNPKINKEQWSDEQDDLLLKLVALHGSKSWTRIAEQIGNRCDVQCRYRYKQLQKDEHFKEKMAKASENAKDMPAAPPPPSRSVQRARTQNNKMQTYQNTIHAVQQIPQMHNVPVFMNAPQYQLYPQQMPMAPILAPIGKYYQPQMLGPQIISQQIMQPQSMNSQGQNQPPTPSSPTSQNQPTQQSNQNAIPPLQQPGQNMIQQGNGIMSQGSQGNLLPPPAPMGQTPILPGQIIQAAPSISQFDSKIGKQGSLIHFDENFQISGQPSGFGESWNNIRGVPSSSGFGISPMGSFI